MGHLGNRVSALLDGQLPPEEAERAWAHVHVCHLCRDAVEREGWVKTRLARLSAGPHGAPDHLKGSLLGGNTLPAGRGDHDRPRRAAMVLLGGSAAGVAVLGVVALGLGGGSAPTPSRDAPVTNFGGSDGSRQLPARVPGPTLRPTAPSPSR
ncbi:MAG: hypothetical protein ACXWDL_05140 [Nocardioides sp.]